MKAKAKTINLLLNEGTLKGVMSMAASSWNSGELFSAPRESVESLLESEACSKFGVYLLLSENMVYVGQSSDLAKRIKQHIIGKPWWERVVILTTSNNSLTRSDIDYLESELIKKAEKSDRLDCDNRNKGNTVNVSKFREVELSQYLEEALFLMELIGIAVFSDQENSKKNKGRDKLFSTIDLSTQQQIEIRAKREARRFLQENSIVLDDDFTYAKRQDNVNVFWMNPRRTVLEKEWDIVLNDQFSHELLVIHVPANTFRVLSGDAKGFYVRNDRKEVLDINIAGDQLTERKSKIDFTPYVVKRIKY
ncbi:MAG: GIY-YIG nuclease family protein [Lachnospiraceae bacterium]|nr:GIY-YIG nuclease family protein [Lachnospiraceae bacterium]